jgi:hypothetical protein
VEGCKGGEEMIVLEVFRGLEERKYGGIKWVEHGLDKRDDWKLL